MGLLSQIDMELQKDLIDFIKAQEEKPYPHTLGDVLIKEILKNIIKGDARLSGCATNHGTKRMYLEISFFENEEEQDKDGKERNETVQSTDPKPDRSHQNSR